MSNVTLIDETIEVLCKAVKIQEKDRDYESVVELTSVLAVLITAKANLNMSSRYMRGSTNQNHKEV